MNLPPDLCQRKSLQLCGFLLTKCRQDGVGRGQSFQKSQPVELSKTNASRLRIVAKAKESFVQFGRTSWFPRHQPARLTEKDVAIVAKCIKLTVFRPVGWRLDCRKTFSMSFTS